MQPGFFCVPKKSKKKLFFLQNAFDKRFSCAILVALTGKTGNNASPENEKERETAMENTINELASGYTEYDSPEEAVRDICPGAYDEYVEEASGCNNRLSALCMDFLRCNADIKKISNAILVRVCN